MKSEWIDRAATFERGELVTNGSIVYLVTGKGKTCIPGGDSDHLFSGVCVFSYAKGVDIGKFSKGWFKGGYKLFSETLKLEN